MIQCPSSPLWVPWLVLLIRQCQPWEYVRNEWSKQKLEVSELLKDSAISLFKILNSLTSPSELNPNSSLSQPMSEIGLCLPLWPHFLSPHFSGASQHLSLWAVIQRRWASSCFMTFALDCFACGSWCASLHHINYLFKHHHLGIVSAGHFKAPLVSL